MVEGSQLLQFREYFNQQAYPEQTKIDSAILHYPKNSECFTLCEKILAPICRRVAELVEDNVPEFLPIADQTAFTKAHTFYAHQLSRIETTISAIYPKLALLKKQFYFVAAFESTIMSSSLMNGKQKHFDDDRRLARQLLLKIGKEIKAKEQTLKETMRNANFTFDTVEQKFFSADFMRFKDSAFIPLPLLDLLSKCEEKIGHFFFIFDNEELTEEIEHTDILKIFSCAGITSFLEQLPEAHKTRFQHLLQLHQALFIQSSTLQSISDQELLGLDCVTRLQRACREKITTTGLYTEAEKFLTNLLQHPLGLKLESTFRLYQLRIYFADLCGKPNYKFTSSNGTFDLTPSYPILIFPHEKNLSELIKHIILPLFKKINKSPFSTAAKFYEAFFPLIEEHVDAVDRTYLKVHTGINKLHETHLFMMNLPTIKRNDNIAVRERSLKSREYYLEIYRYYYQQVQLSFAEANENVWNDGAVIYPPQIKDSKIMTKELKLFLPEDNQSGAYHYFNNVPDFISALNPYPRKIASTVHRRLSNATLFLQGYENKLRLGKERVAQEKKLNEYAHTPQSRQPMATESPFSKLPQPLTPLHGKVPNLNSREKDKRISVTPPPSAEIPASPKLEESSTMPPIPQVDTKTTEQALFPATLVVPTTEPMASSADPGSETTAPLPLPIVTPTTQPTTEVADTPPLTTPTVTTNPPIPTANTVENQQYRYVVYQGQTWKCPLHGPTIVGYGDQAIIVNEENSYKPKQDFIYQSLFRACLQHAQNFQSNFLKKMSHGSEAKGRAEDLKNHCGTMQSKRQMVEHLYNFLTDRKNGGHGKDSLRSHIIKQFMTDKLIAEEPFQRSEEFINRKALEFKNNALAQESTKQPTAPVCTQ